MPYTPPPPPKPWTIEEMKALIELAGRKGIKTARELSQWIGVHESTLSKYLKGTRALDDAARNAMSWAEFRIKKLKDVPQRETS
jgi:hypothetical protein